MGYKTNEEKFRARHFRILLYKEDATHMEALKIIQQDYNCAFILHDKDLEDDSEDVKKEHYHIVLSHPNALWSSALAQKLGITENYIRKADNLDKALEYLIHLNNPEKFQYQLNEVQGNLRVKLVELVEKGVRTESMRVLEIIEVIENTNAYISITELSKWCAINGLWADYRRAFSCVKEMVYEHNKPYTTNKDNN